MKVIVVPCSFDNYAYIIICETTGKAAVIDPTEAYPVMMEIEKAGGKLVAVLCTHHHGDHVGDIETLKSEISELAVYCHISDEKRIYGANRLLKDGDRFPIGDLELAVLQTPGHTRGSISYQVHDLLFTGDTLFGAGCGRLFEGTPEKMHASLNKLGRLPDTTKIYFGHEYTRQNLSFAVSIEPNNEAIASRLEDIENMGGEITSPSTLGLEKATNPFLRCTEIVLPGCETPLEVFTKLRQLKDSF